MKTNKAIYSDLAIPPGEFLEEVLKDLGMSKGDLAKRMGRPPSKLSEIYTGAKTITPETALQLEIAVGVPAHIWTGLESEYRLVLARKKAEEMEKNETYLVKKFCYPELVEAGEVKATNSLVEKVRELRSFFGVSSLQDVINLQPYQAAFRCSNVGERSPEAIAAWLRMGERRAQRKFCTPYNENKLRHALAKLRKMTWQTPEVFQNELDEELTKCGVALVICPHFQKTRAHGATFWIGSEKAVLMVTIRGKKSDIFWFSLFHEIGHILLHDCKEVILEDGDQTEKEREANNFASDTLIPKDDYEEFIAKGRFTRKNVLTFSEMINIDPGIVVGRLQYDNKIEYNNRLNKLKRSFNWGK